MRIIPPSEIALELRNPGENGHDHLSGVSLVVIGPWRERLNEASHPLAFLLRIYYYCGVDRGLRVDGSHRSADSLCAKPAYFRGHPCYRSGNMGSCTIYFVVSGT